MDKVCVLMSTYNGEKYLKEQLDSILNQKNVDVDLIVRDDNSSDKTIDILQKYNKQNKLKFYKGENLGPAHSFMELLYNAPKADYYAFSDQDDVWLEEKLKAAVVEMKETNKKYVIYSSGVEIVDKDLKKISINNFKKASTLAASFIQSPIAGCTMVINNKMRDVIISKKIQDIEIGMHDSWIYRIGLCIGADIIFDKKAYIKYRQHENNVIGAQKEGSILKKLNRVVCKRKKFKSTVAKNILTLYGEIINDEDKAILKKVANLERNNSLLNKLNIILDKRFRTPNKNANIKFIYDVFKNRI